MAVVPDRFQRKGRGSAGAEQAAVSFDHTMVSLIPCEIIEEEGSGRCAVSCRRG
jgi:hypothetical protein